MVRGGPTAHYRAATVGRAGRAGVERAWSRRRAGLRIVPTVDDVGIGRLLRAIRVRRGWRQLDVAARAGMSQSQVSRIEAGQLELLRLGDLRRIGSALEVRLRLEPSWRGGDGTRLVNEGHVSLQGRIAGRIARIPGWAVSPEVTFAALGERGIIDLLAWHEAARALLVVEVKTELLDPGGLIAQVDRYGRVARAVARERGWHATTIGTWVVLGDSTMNRRRTRLASTLLRHAYPATGSQMRPWLRCPSGPIRALSFARVMPAGNGARRTVPIRRVSRRRNSAERPHHPGDA